MKKILTTFVVFSLCLFVSACSLMGKKPTAEIIDIVEGRTKIECTVSVEDKGVVSEDSVRVKLYKDDDLISSQNMTGFEPKDFTFTGLKINTKYELRVYATYEKKSRCIEKTTVRTNDLGSEANPYKISSVKDFELIREDYASDVHYIMVNDVDFEGEKFDYLCGSASKAFSGLFDGQGYKIKNVKVDASKSAYAGFISYNKGTIKNVTFEGIEVTCKKTTTSTIYSGIIGYNNGGVINDVDAKDVKIIAESTTVYAGGLTGYNYGGVIKNCSIEGLDIDVNKASAKAYVGGIVAYNRLSDTNKYGKIENCSADGSILIQDASDVQYGGAVGEATSKSSLSKITIDIDATIYASGTLNAGGLIGYTREIQVNNILVKGNINYTCATTSKENDAYVYTDTKTSKNVYVGGVVGSATHVSLENCVVETNINAKYNLEKSNETDTSITADARFGIVFGAGFDFRTGAKHCYFLGNIEVTTDEESAVKTTISKFDGSEGAEQGINHMGVVSLTINGVTTSEGTNAVANDLLETLKFDNSIWTITDVEGKAVAVLVHPDNTDNK